MNFTFSGKKLTSLVTVLPANELHFEDELDQFNFSRAKSMKLKKIMGFDKHRLVEGDTCASDLCLHGLQHLFAREVLKPEEIDALIFISQSPDHFLPPTSNIIQGKAGLKEDILCMDINQGCAGFVLGLFQAFLLLEQPAIRKVALLNGDTLSRKVSRRDRSIYPMIGDAGSVTIVEKDEDAETILGSVKMNGAQSHTLCIPAGGFRQFSTPETAVEHDDGSNNFRSEDHFRMDGQSVFNFVQTHVPPMIEELLQRAEIKHDDVDAFLFHQPNKFMLQKLADKMKVPHDKMPNDIVSHFGNASSVTIPSVIAFHLAQTIESQSILACLAGFGVGLTWASMLLKLGPLDLCEIIDYP